LMEFNVMRIAFAEAAAIYSPPLDAAMTFPCEINETFRKKWK
jgi:hypothetical protein